MLLEQLVAPKLALQEEPLSESARFSEVHLDLVPTRAVGDQLQQQAQEVVMWLQVQWPQGQIQAMQVG